MGRVSVAAEIVIELTGWSKKMEIQDGVRIGHIGGLPMHQTDSRPGASGFRPSLLIRVTKRIRRSQSSARTFGMVTA